MLSDVEKLINFYEDELQQLLNKEDKCGSRIDKCLKIEIDRLYQIVYSLKGLVLAELCKKLK